MRHESVADKTQALASEADNVYFPCASGLGMLSRFGGKESCAEFRITTKVAAAPELRDTTGEILIDRIEPIPDTLLARIWAIFRAVYEKHRSEMFLYLGWNKKKKRYYISIPTSIVASGGHLRYTPSPNKRFVGSFHSHGSMSAFYSGEDNTNEMGSSTTGPGIYGVMGNVCCTQPSVVLSLAGMGQREHLTHLLPATIQKIDLPERELQWWTRTFRHVSETYTKDDQMWSRDDNCLLVDYSRPLTKQEGHYQLDAPRQKTRKKKKTATALARRLMALIDDLREFAETRKEKDFFDVLDKCAGSAKCRGDISHLATHLSEYIAWYEGSEPGTFTLPGEEDCASIYVTEDTKVDDIDLSKVDLHADWVSKRISTASARDTFWNPEPPTEEEREDSWLYTHW